MYTTIDQQCLGMVPWDGRVRKNKTETGLLFLGNFSLNVFPGNPLLYRDKYVEPRTAWDVSTSWCPVASLFGSSTTSTPLEALPTPLPREPSPKILEHICVAITDLLLIYRTLRGRLEAAGQGSDPNPSAPGTGCPPRPWQAAPGLFRNGAALPASGLTKRAGDGQRDLGLCGAVPSAVSGWVTFVFASRPASAAASWEVPRRPLATAARVATGCTPPPRNGATRRRGFAVGRAPASRVGVGPALSQPHTGRTF